MLRSAFAIVSLLGFVASTPSAFAQAPDPLAFQKFLNELAAKGRDRVQAITPTFVRTFGLGPDHRAYVGAVTPNLDIGIEATLFKVPADLWDALATAGIDVGDESISAFPSPKLHFLKSFGRRFSLGISTIFYKGYWIAGGHLQFLIVDPPEGFQWALRLGFNRSKLDYVNTSTYSVQVVASKRLEFAEPYVGVGFHASRGTVSITLSPQEAAQQGITLPPEYASGIYISTNGAASSAFGTLGVAFWFGPSGLKLTLEGAYDSKSMHSLGIMFSLAI